MTRAIRVRGLSNGPIRLAVAKNDPVVLLEFRESVVVADVVSFSVRNRNPQHSARLEFISKRTIRRFHAHVNVFADKVQILIANQCAWKKSRFTEDLKSVTYSE